VPIFGAKRRVYSMNEENRTVLRILCIEDNPLDRELLRRQLDRELGWDDLRFELHFAGTLGEAIMYARSQAVDVCVVDLVLPDSRGVETLHAIRSVMPNVAVVVVTGDTDLLTVRQSMYANVQGYLVKGEFASSALVRTVLAAWERSLLERRLAETMDQFRRLQAQYRALLEFLPDAVIMTDAEERILYLNPAAQELLGRSAGELLGQVLPHTFGGHSSDVVIPHRDGRLRYAVLRTERAIVEGQPVVLYFLHDVTDRRAVELEQRQRERSELLGLLASGIAHDLNNLLSPIMLGVQTLLRLDSDERVQKVLMMIEQSAKRSAELIRQVLSYARTNDTDLQAVRPYDVVEDAVRSFRSSIPPTIELNVSGGDPSIPPIYADRLQLFQLLLNLLRNAREAIGSSGGSISVSVTTANPDDPRLMGRGIAQTKYVVFQVSDTGCGIPEHIRPHIFEPFFTTKPKGEGTGLGLYTVLTIVKRHRGTIHIDSAVGLGTTVSVFLPQVETTANNARAVLIVSPSATLRQLVGATLGAVGFDIVEASSVSEALGMFINAVGNIEIVVADDDRLLDGIEKIRTIKELKPEIRIVLLCSMLAQQSIAELESTVIDRFVAKPFTDQMLLEAVGSLVGHHWSEP